MDQIGVVVYMVRKDMDCCIGVGCLLNSGVFFGGSDEKFMCVGGGQCGGNVVRCQFIVICFNYGVGFGGFYSGQ